MKNWQILKVAALVVAGGAFAMAGTVCPAGNGANPFPHNPDNAASGCNAVITIAASGAASTAIPDSTPYENSEDVLVGVVNNSATPVASLNISGTTGPFGFDGDGICTYTFVGSAYCAGKTSDPADYQGPTSTFTNVSGSGNSGTVNFSPAIAAGGGSSYFSLEGLPTANLAVSTGPLGTPAPSSILLMMTALAGVGLFFLGRRMAGSSVR